jgi:hypothetical protein
MGVTIMESDRWWRWSAILVDANSETRTINVPATGDIDEAGLADLYEFLIVAAKVAGIM